jgi:ectoine hydroxylase-related dioxygenase (phytanoyl-CoA dioxygenase family)
LKTLNAGWLDRPDALEILNGLKLHDWQSKALNELILDGFTVLPSMISPHVCDRVIADYNDWAQDSASYVAQNLDDHGREKRLVNFHLASDAAMSVATDRNVMELLDFFFGERSEVYTSLTFKYGTQQPIHRDTPHFATWPPNRFCGVWTAYEDVDASAGPLMYIRGGHRFAIDQLEIYQDSAKAMPESSSKQKVDDALDRYNGRILETSPGQGELVVAPIRKGDVAIWHPQLPHGGSPAKDPFKTRWSMVVHCSPESVQVHQHEQFFTHEGPSAPAPRYGHLEAFGRRIAVSGETAFM